VPDGPTFEVLRTVGQARRGRLRCAHGVVETPAFMPVGTLGAVKGLGPAQLRECGAQVMLANLYHLTLTPGVDQVSRLGGLHRFTGWPGPILTDSGGFQIWSLSGLRRVDDEGVTFRSPRDGRLVRFEPEAVVRDQAAMGVDVAMMLDECTPWPVSEAEAAVSLRRTASWARRARTEKERLGATGTLLFGIVQGSFYADLRRRAVEDLSALDFDGYAIGGVSIGESKERGCEVVAAVAPALPGDRPRYLMGVGTPEDIAAAVAAGVDLFDCVLPSRNARHGFLFTRTGAVRIHNAAFRADERPLDEGCACSTCSTTSRAFLHHLFRTGEITAQVLATVHNVRFYLDFMGGLREALMLGRTVLPASAPISSQPRPPSAGGGP
jgi:queuine tRNA-ribosyltransferase